MLPFCHASAMGAWGGKIDGAGGRPGGMLLTWGWIWVRWIYRITRPRPHMESEMLEAYVLIAVFTAAAFAVVFAEWL